MAARMTAVKLRTALASRGSSKLLVKTPRGRGYHKVTAVSTVTMSTNRLMPDTATSTDNLLVLTLEPIVAFGSTTSSFVGKPSSTLPNLDSETVYTASQVVTAIRSDYYEYDVAIADSSGITICEMPVRTSSVTETDDEGSSTTVAVLNLF